jgi:hypothetical protein
MRKLFFLFTFCAGVLAAQAQTFSNGLTNSGTTGAGAIVKLGGPLTAATTVDLTTFSLLFKSTAQANLFNILPSGNIGVGIPTPLSSLHLKAGSATIAPLIFSATVPLAAAKLTTPIAGAMEFDGVSLYFTPTTVLGQKIIAYADLSNLSGGFVPVTKGGTGLVASTPGGILYGAAVANTTAFTAAGTSGSLLTSGGAAAPTWTTPATLIANNAWALTGNTATIPGTQFIGTTDAQRIVFKTGGVEQATILAASGNVGIGLAAPTALVHIKAGTATNAPFKLTSSGTGVFLTTAAAGAMEYDGTNLYFTPVATRKTIAFNDFSNMTGGTAGQVLTSAGTTLAPTWSTLSAGGGWSLLGNATTNPTTNFIGTTDAQRLVFRTANVEQVTILPTSGNVGIGIAAPLHKLDVLGNIRFSGALLTTVATNPGGTTGQVLTSTGSATAPIWTTIAGGTDATKLAILNNLSDLNNVTTARTNLGLGNVDNTSDINKPIATATQAALNLKANLASPTFTGTPVFPGASIPNTALANNSITIGTTNIALGATVPTLAGLTSVTSTAFVGALNGNATTATTATNIVGGVAGAILYQTGVGATGMSAVGTSGYVLTSGGAGAPTWTAATALPSNAWSLLGNAGTNPNAATNSNFIGTTDLQRLVFKTNSIEQATILSGGNVGIGTATPTNALHVEKNANTNVGALVINSNTGGSAAATLTVGSSTTLDQAMYLYYGGTGNTVLGSLKANLVAASGTTGGMNVGVLANAPLSFGTNSNTRMMILGNGNIGIGTTAPSEKLDINGNIYTNGKILIGQLNTAAVAPYALAVNGSAIFTKATVKLNANWPDFVFEPTYNLPTLSQVEAYITKHKHLQGVPSATEVKEKGIDLGDNQTILLKKVEELTLYMIELNKKVEILAKENEALKKKVNGDK